MTDPNIPHLPELIPDADPAQPNSPSHHSVPIILFSHPQVAGRDHGTGRPVDQARSKQIKLNQAK